MYKKSPRVQLQSAWFVDAVWPQAERIEWSRIGEGAYRDYHRFDLEDRPDIKLELPKINSFMMNEYMLRNGFIWEVHYEKDKLYEGNEYIFMGGRGKIQGKVSIVPSHTLLKEKEGDKVEEVLHYGDTFYVFRTWVNFFEVDEHTCKNMLNFVSENLEGLEMVRTVFSGYGYPDNICEAPVLCQNIDGNFNVDSFKEFMKNIEKFADRYTLITDDRIRTNYFL